MSIYATEWILQFPRHGEAHSECEWVTVIGQGVPAHIGTPTPGYGYEGGDPYAAFLPPAVPVQKGGQGPALRAIVIVRDGTEKRGQQYVEPLLVLSGEEYARISFPELHGRICNALRGGRPRLVGEFRGADGSCRMIFDDGSSKTIDPDKAHTGLEEVARRGEEIFERRIRPSLEPCAKSRFVAIDVDSEDYELDDRDLLAVTRLRQRHPEARVWLRKTDSRYARLHGAARPPESKA